MSNSQRVKRLCSALNKKAKKQEDAERQHSVVKSVIMNYKKGKITYVDAYGACLDAGVAVPSTITIREIARVMQMIDDLEITAVEGSLQLTAMKIEIPVTVWLQAKKEIDEKYKGQNDQSDREYILHHFNINQSDH